MVHRASAVSEGSHLEAPRLTRELVWTKCLYRKCGHTHVVEDVSHHSIPDNYWCYMYERQVKYYKRQTTNMKTLCKTLADRAAQLQFVQSYLDCNIPPARDRFEVPSSSDIAIPPVLLQARSMEDATSLPRVAQTYTRVLCINDYDFATAILVYGPICNQYYHFLDGNYYVAKTSGGIPVIDQWTKQPYKEALQTAERVSPPTTSSKGHTLP